MTLEQIREGFQSMAGASGPAVTNIAKVKSVDETKAICVLEDEDGQEILDVRLRPVLTGKKSFLQVPKIGGSVLAGGNQPHNNMPPYRIIKYIEFIGFD